MTDNQSAYEQSVVELEFGLDESEFFLAAVSEETECTLEYLSEAPGIQEVRLLHENGNEAFFELISESQITKTLANEEVFLKYITVSEGEGHLTAEVPSHIDVSSVIESFLMEYPEAELIARRETTRQAPSILEGQFINGLLEELTEKQLRALRVAHANGYFEFPRQHKADEIAELFGVSTPTFSQHLRVAERKLLDKIF